MKGFLDITCSLMNMFHVPNGLIIMGSADCTGMHVIRLVVETKDGFELPATYNHVEFIYSDNFVISQKIVKGYHPCAGGIVVHDERSFV